MSLIGLVITLVVVGVLLWLLNNYVPMDQGGIRTRRRAGRAEVRRID
jgi:hypothetical protein